jgi:hypothetical protein
MNTNKERFSELISQLTEMWLLWMKNNTISHNKSIEVSIRKKAIDECEKLIDLEYTIVSKLDNFFDNGR